MPQPAITPSDLKTILHSKRANIYYLEKCRIQVNGGRVEYISQKGKESFYWNTPIANTTAVMPGKGIPANRFLDQGNYLADALDVIIATLQETASTLAGVAE